MLKSRIIKEAIWGLHDIEKEEVGVLPGDWRTQSISFSDDKPEYYIDHVNRMIDAGKKVIMRLNWGYHPVGTIPTRAQWGKFIAKCAYWCEVFDRVDHFIIGNEPNLPIERPGGIVIPAAKYADLFNRVRPAMKNRRPYVNVLPAAIAPWNTETGPWIRYFQEMLNLVDCDGIVIHTYSRGYNPEDVSKKLYMKAEGYTDKFSGFLAYRDFMNAIPDKRSNKSVYITETNGNMSWDHYQPGWMQATVDEIYRWNAVNNQQIECLCFYRQTYDDGYKISSRAMEDYMKLYIPNVQKPEVSKPEEEGSSNGPPYDPALRPLVSLPFNKTYPITQHFVGNYDFYKKYGSVIGHNGVDFGVPVGTPVYSSWEGIVIETGNWSTWGNYLKVRHSQLGAEFLYAHLREEPDEWKIDSKFPPGEILAWTGNTGNSLGPHLHWSVRLIDNKGRYIYTSANHRGYVDPLLWVQQINEFIRRGLL